MNRWKLAVPLIFSGALFAAGCAPAVAVGPGPEAPDAPPAAVTVNTAPPPEQVEVVPVQPSSNVVWVRGHWHWNGGGWVWIRGHWVTRRVGWHFVPGHYEARGGVFLYIGPHWAPG